jgi:glycerophosphoryl diester phosphodiesterase
MLPHALVYAQPQRLLELRALAPSVRLLPEIMDPAQAARLLETFRPEFAAYSARSLHPEPFALARRAGVKVLADALGPNDQPAFWQAALDAGAAGLQTDRPAELLAWLRAR